MTKAKYMVVANWIKDQIDKGSLHHGDKIQTEAKISKQFGYSRQTIRQAISLLINEGLLESTQGSGTYVKKSKRSEKESKVVGVITTYNTDYIFPRILGGIEEVLADHEYAMQLGFTHNRVSDERRALELMIQSNVDGFIIEPTRSALPNPNMDLYQSLMDQGYPLLFINASYQVLPSVHVALDDRKTGQMIYEYVYERGHRRIFSFFKYDDIQGHLRYSGANDASKLHGQQISDEDIFWYSTDDFEKGFMNEMLLDKLKDYTAILCYNDALAYQLLEFLEAHDIKVPEQISIVSVDHTDFIGKSDVEITSVAHPLQKLGSTAAKTMLEMIQKPTYNKSVDFQPKLVEGNSVKNIQQNGGGYDE
ncbi:GntR family transcriptional regulator of arabinose operon [Breznakia blatticola]|uniref:GntR family transcriptional regulator of arabinose operon n=1 Tax=Breznakia blatticola TaxID=1754012 RepID=A0A4V3G961_9FIRM|nr:GntR family transcriptional regulator [Breznakia blatticola]TDW25557.1 GntR family transcriptional regulator of arabinose operon [Breznakia blatticola]